MVKNINPLSKKTNPRKPGPPPPPFFKSGSYSTELGKAYPLVTRCGISQVRASIE